LLQFFTEPQWVHLPQVMADIMGAEAALVRIQFMSGTHAIAAALFAALRPGDEMLALAGK
jgi:cystathionine beta-lyase family protein involved in aluminum resistance